VLFLDEPTSGLDPQSRAHMWDLVRRLRDDGMTVFPQPTHYLDEADALCDRVAIIDHGEIVAEGTPDALKRAISGDVRHGRASSAARRRPPTCWLASRTCGRSRPATTTSLRLTAEAGETALPQLMRTLEGAGIELSTIELHRPTLDDVFLTKTGALAAGVVTAYADLHRALISENE